MEKNGKEGNAAASLLRRDPLLYVLYVKYAANFVNVRLVGIIIPNMIY